MVGTGIAPGDYRKLSPEQRRQLALWTLTKCGGEVDKGQVFLPNAVRWLAIETRLELAADPALDAAWEEAERRRVAHNHVYFIEAYGHLRPPVGAVIPFDLWPEQRAIAAELLDHLLWLWLKARQLGMTWLALHYAFWIVAFSTEDPVARVLALSKHGGDASKLIQRARLIREYLPAFIRPAEANDTRRSLTRFGIAGRGEMVSLPGTPDAARSETARLILLDEFGFIRNRQAGPTWTAAKSTIGQLGQAIILSTGNGPPEAPGDGQAFARLVEKATSGDESEGAFRFVFLPASTDPARRSRKWRETEAETYETREEFEAEHPETIEQALQGLPGTKFYPPAGVNAAERIGRALDELRVGGAAPDPAPPERALLTGIDWGEQTAGLVLWPLERGGVYVPAEVIHSHREPEELAAPLLGRAAELGTVGPSMFDAAGVQSMRSFTATARRTRWPGLRTVSIPFGDYKEEATRYLRRLFRRSAALAVACDREGLQLADVLSGRVRPPSTPCPVCEGTGEDEGDDCERCAGSGAVQAPTTQIIGISPECSTLLRQTRGLQFADDDSGKVEKGDDHAPDALAAGIAPTARRHRAARADPAAGDDFD